MFILRRVDRAGVLDDVRTPEDLLVVLNNGMPLDLVERGFSKLLKYEVVEVSEHGLVIPNFLEAQESTKSNALRQREKRERKRMRTRAVSQGTQSVSRPTQGDTRRHKATQGDTPTSAVQCSTVQCSTDNTAPARVDTNNEFEKFWKAYPKRVGKKAALKAWTQAKKGNLPDIVRLVMVIEKQKRSAQWRQNNGQYIPNPATWLNQGRWDDEVNTKMGAPKTQHQRNLEILGLSEGDDGERSESEPVSCDDIRIVPR